MIYSGNVKLLGNQFILGDALIKKKHSNIITFGSKARKIQIYFLYLIKKSNKLKLSLSVKLELGTS